MEKFVYSSPPEHDPKLPSASSIEIMKDAENLGHALLQYFSKPTPLYYVAYIHINEDKRGQGYGGDIMEYIERFLRQRGKAGILSDGIARHDPNSLAQGMYAKRGWIEIPGTTRFVYNLPADTTAEDLRYFIERKNRPDREARLNRRYVSERLEQSGDSAQEPPLA